MNEDERFRQLLRSAFPESSERGPLRDLWPQVVERVQQPQPWTWIDLAVTAGVATALLLVPEWVFVLAYHL